LSAPQDADVSRHLLDIFCRLQVPEGTGDPIVADRASKLARFGGVKDVATVSREGFGDQRREDGGKAAPSHSSPGVADVGEQAENRPIRASQPSRYP
jgi:hypothetical protein